MSDPTNYNPLDKVHLGESIIRALLDTVPEPLGDIQPFRGVGIYAIYYTGDFSAYQKLAERNMKGKFEMPIYVGKAVPKGARKGIDTVIGKELYNRLKDHADSIKQSANLQLKDFYCRHLNIDDVWIPLGETLLIERFHPLWNLLVDGFGNHDPGAGRREGKLPIWDMLHPGRGWASKQQPRIDDVNAIKTRIQNYL
jgi:hypothetical protein